MAFRVRLRVLGLLPYGLRLTQVFFVIPFNKNYRRADGRGPPATASFTFYRCDCI